MSREAKLVAPLFLGNIKLYQKEANDFFHENYHNRLTYISIIEDLGNTNYFNNTQSYGNDSRYLFKFKCWL